MEIGNPQLYAEANRVARNLDKTFLKELGPFLQALGEVTFVAEKYKSEGDKIAPGETLGGKSMNMAGSFMLFRGAAMQDDWVKPYADKVGQKIMILQSTSCSKSLIVVLRLAMPETIKDN